MENYNDHVCSECGETPRDHGFNDDNPWEHWACPDHYDPHGGCDGILRQQKPENE